MTEYSVAMTDAVAAVLTQHLQRSDGQEDICFVLYKRATGAARFTALLVEPLLPKPGDRNVHGNVSFNPAYLERALSEASAKGCGLALVHSHPNGRGWQGLSDDDIRAENGIGPSVYGATELPLLGMIQAGDHTWSARLWMRTGYRQYQRNECTRVRIVGERFKVDFNPMMYPPPAATQQQVRTVSAWGERHQAVLARLKVGVIGAGSVGGLVAEGLARTGISNLTVIDFDKVEVENLDRLTYADLGDVGQPKIRVLERKLRLAATSSAFELLALPVHLQDRQALAAALDCDVLFSCVDRPLGRHLLNQISYSHLIPVIDGGILARTNKSGLLAAADWRTHVAAPARACLRCLGQYDLGLVQAEREGSLDNPMYIKGLPDGHPLKARQNVFAFTVACGSRQLLQFLSMILEPLGSNDFGAEHYHFVGDHWEPKRWPACEPECPVNALTARGDGHHIV